MAKVTFKSKGFDELHNLLERKQRNLKALGDLKSVPIAEILPDKFIRKNTKFHSLEQMLDQSGMKGVNLDTSKAWDKFVATNSRFSGWVDMKNTAFAEMVKRKLAE